MPKTIDFVNDTKNSIKLQYDRCVSVMSTLYDGAYDGYVEMMIHIGRTYAYDIYQYGYITCEQLEEIEDYTYNLLTQMQEI